MKLPKPVVLLMCCVLIAGRAPAQTKKLRVVSSAAKIYIEPHSSSTVIGTVPKGAILTLFDSGSQEKSWYYISFYSEEKWATLTGFVAASQVEVMGAPAPEPAEERQVPPKKPVPAKRPPQKPVPTQPPEKKITESAAPPVKAEPVSQTKIPAEPEQPEELKPYAGEVKIMGEKPAVRASASEDGRIMAVAKFGEVLELTGVQGDWYRVKYPRADGIVLVGFMHLDQVEVLSCVALEESGLETEPEPNLEDEITLAVEKSKIEPETPVEVEKERAKPPSDQGTVVPLGFENKILGLGVSAGTSMPSETLYGSGFAYGAGVSYLVTPNLGVELSLLKYQSDIEGSDSGLSRGRLSMIPLMFSIQGRYPLKGRFVPYAAVGATLSFNSFELCQTCKDNWEALGISINETVENSFGWHVGVGLDYQVTHNLALNVDVRTHFLKSQGNWSMDDLLSNVSVSGDLDDLNINTWIFRIGAKFYFRLF